MKFLRGPTATRSGRRDYNVLIVWTIVMGVIVFGFVVAGDLGLLRLVLESDISRISAGIFAIFVVFSGHCCWLAVTVSRERALAGEISRMVKANTGALRVSEQGDVIIGRTALPNGLMADHVRNLIEKSARQDDGRVDQTVLIQNLADSLSDRESIGWFVSDSLVKLGLLGTIIGFILMLRPVANIEDFDVETLKRALSAMTGGMAVALFTTLSGLIGSTLLRLQYQVIDKGVVGLIDEISSTTEVHVVPQLDKRNAPE